MRNRIVGRVAMAARSVARLVVFLVPLVAGLGIVSSRAQQIPDLNPDQLMQLKQQFGQGAGASGTGTYGQNNPPPVVLMPAVPKLQDELPSSRLEQIMSARTGARLKQFGYDQLGRASAVTVPQTGAVQDDYVLGPSDEVVVSLRGQENSEIRATVNRDGQVVMPRLSPIPATGRSLGDFRRDVQAAVRRAYVATDAYVSVGHLRQVSVLVSGEVNNPGLRLLTGLSSVVDALLISGGVKKTGSLRNIRVQRNGRDIPIDLYDVLTVGGGGVNFRLADGDRILVPALGPTVAVSGLVRQPGIYEMPRRATGLSVRALMNLAGGQEVRGRYRLSILRILGDGRTSLAPVAENDQVHDSEVLFVQMGADQTVSQATLSGGTGLAGNYPIAAGTKLSVILNAPGALGSSPYTPFGIIVRKDPQTLIRHLVPFTPSAVLSGREDEVLQSDDIVRVLSVNESRLLTFILRSYLTRLARDQNRIRNPLSQAAPDAENSVFGQLASQSGLGAELDDISSVPAYIQRQDITALLDVPAPDSQRALDMAERARQANAFQMNQRNAAVPGQNQAGNPGQQNSYGPTPGYGYGNPPANNLGANQGYVPPLPEPGYGAMNADQNRYRQYGDNERPGLPGNPDRLNNEPPAAANFTDQVVPSGGFALNREIETFGEFARQLGIDPLVLINFMIDNRVRLDGAVLGPGSYLAGPNATLNDLVQAAGGTINWADESGVEVISTIVDRDTGRAVTGRKSLPLRKGMLASYVVHARDQFRFAQISTDVGVGSVTVQGEVRHPGSFPILRGEHLSDLLLRAGGLTETAFPYGTVFLRQSAAQAERQAYVREADEIQNQLIVAMTRIGSSKIDPNTFASMQSFVSEVRNHQALGRVSFIADPKVLASDPSRDPLLEAGDVIYIPPRPTTVAVLGEVLQPGNFTVRRGLALDDYIEQAGGYSAIADESHTYIVLPDGHARRVTRSWLSFEAETLPPGSTIVVPRDVTPLDLRQTIIDVSQIFSQFAVSIASVAVLSRQ